MKSTIQAIVVMAALVTASSAVAQRTYDDNRMDERFERSRDSRDERNDDRERQFRQQERDMRRDDRRRDDDASDFIRDRRDYRRRELEMPRYDNDYRERTDRNEGRRYDRNDLAEAYDEGFEDGQKSFEKQQKEEYRENYKNFTFGIYGGANSTSFQGERLDANGSAAGLQGRLGYQLGFFVRGGGRFYGQIGAEYLASSSEFYSTNPGSGTLVSGPGSSTGTTLQNIIGNVNQRYLHVPAYVGVKLAQSERGISAIRLQVGAEFSTPVGNGRNADLNITRDDFNEATLNGLANLGLDAGPLFIDFVYHHGFQNVLRDNTRNSQRRILAVNVGFKF